jgi:type II secretory pathway pseudopilin PulG
MIFKKKQKKTNKKTLIVGRRGFTFIEVIMGMGIVVFLSATMFSVIGVSTTRQGLVISAEKVKAGIRLAQTYSLSVPQESSGVRHICGYGIKDIGVNSFQIYYLYAQDTYFANDNTICDNNSYLTYSGSSGINEIDLQVIELEGNYEIISSNDIFFKAPYGEIVDDGTKLSSGGVASFRIRNNKNSESIEIEVNSSGRINLE